MYFIEKDTVFPSGGSLKLINDTVRGEPFCLEPCQRTADTSMKPNQNVGHFLGEVPLYNDPIIKSLKGEGTWLRKNH
ncbi:MAG: hypothetical protein A2157_04165 [Deltaproteobacteria bacterium RBG_16_47_11]|nr:MAG: hypothetical protein A2157_04165 [Deltaproteobacteria bacterium RBG_16_47_11]